LPAVAYAGIVPRISLHLGLLVRAQHNRVLRRIQVQPRDIVDPLDKERIGGQLERIGHVRLTVNAA